MTGRGSGIRNFDPSPRRSCLHRGRAVWLSLVWLWLVLGTPILAETSGRGNADAVAEQLSKNATRSETGSLATEDSAESRKILLASEGEESPAIHESERPRRSEDQSKEQHNPGPTGLPEDAKFLAGPSSGEHSLYSNHSCTCHASKSNWKSSSLFSEDVSNGAGEDAKSLTVCTGGDANSETPCLARVFYLVSIHNERTLSDALYLFRAIRDARNTVLIHIDTKFGLEPYLGSPLRKEIEACPCGATVEVASVHDCRWGSWSMNLPTLWSMTKAVAEYAGKWDVFCNLSGDTLPVYSADRIAELFGGPLRGINFVTSVACETGLVPTAIGEFPEKWHKRKHYSHDPPKHLEYADDDGVVHRDASVEIFFGSQWVSLTPDVCGFFVEQLARPDSLPSRFRDWLIRTEKLMADETFFTSMLMRYFPKTLPKLREDDVFLDDPDVSMYAIRYERMDEHVPTSRGYYPTEQRYEVPASTGIGSPRPWGPYFLGTYDLNNIRMSGALYVRKVARAIDPNVYTILPVDRPDQIPPISWPADVKLSPVPDWEKKVAELRKKAMEKESRKKERKD